ncbi:MAG: porin, partial [Bacteroidaceae bacterium]|nr:porin [Bacteroidaceae bacterium]
MLQGDVLPIGQDRHRLFRYQAAVFNGNGQNNRDNNSQKDYMGDIQLQPIKGLYIGLFGWTGTYTGTNGATVSRNRWALGAKYEYKDWTFRGEYAHHSGYNCTNYDAETQTFYGPHEADGWQATVGAPCTKWLKVWLRYDAFRTDATWGTLRTIYSIAPNFDLHKNIKLQLQYNYIHDRTFAQKPDYHELWTEVYVRF